MDRTELNARKREIQRLLDENADPAEIHAARDDLYYDVLRAIAKAPTRLKKSDLVDLARDAIAAEQIRKNRPTKWDKLRSNGV